MSYRRATGAQSISPTSNICAIYWGRRCNVLLTAPEASSSPPGERIRRTCSGGRHSAPRPPPPRPPPWLPGAVVSSTKPIARATHGIGTATGDSRSNTSAPPSRQARTGTGETPQRQHSGSGQAPAQQQRQRTWFGRNPQKVPNVLGRARSALWTMTGRFGDPESRHWKRVFGKCRADERRPLPLVCREKEAVRDVESIQAQRHYRGSIGGW